MCEKMNHQDINNGHTHEETLPQSSVELQHDTSQKPREYYRQYGSKTIPDEQIRNYASAKAQEIGVTPEKSPTRDQTINLIKVFLADQKRKYHSLPLGEARESLKKTTPLTREQENKAEEIARERDESPYRVRLDIWQKGHAPNINQRIEVAGLLAEIERLEAIEAMNVHQRTAAEIARGDVRGATTRERLFVGCDDSALLLLSELRVVGIAASHVQVVNLDWIDRLRVLSDEEREKEFKRSYHGHVLVKIYPVDGEPIWVDPAGASIKSNSSWEKYNKEQDLWDTREYQNRYYLVKEGIDSADSEPFKSSTREKLQALIKGTRMYVLLN